MGGGGGGGGGGGLGGAFSFFFFCALNPPRARQCGRSPQIITRPKSRVIVVTAIIKP
jgi:hypothetical protein